MDSVLVPLFGPNAHYLGLRGTVQLTALETLMGLWGTDHSHTMANIQANGLVKQLHRHLKVSLRARLDHVNKMDELPCVLLGIRTACKEDQGCCAVVLVYESTIMVPGGTGSQSQSNYFQAPGTKCRASNLCPHLDMK